MNNITKSGVYKIIKKRVNLINVSLYCWSIIKQFIEKYLIVLSFYASLWKLTKIKESFWPFVFEPKILNLGQNTNLLSLFLEVEKSFCPSIKWIWYALRSDFTYYLFAFHVVLIFSQIKVKVYVPTRYNICTLICKKKIIRSRSEIFNISFGL